MSPVLIPPTTEAAQSIPKVVNIDDLIHETAIQNGLNEVSLRKTIECESGFDTHAVGDSGQSFGVVQIHLSDHPEITKEQALDPSFAIPWMGKMWHEGKKNQWTCAREVL